MLLPLIALFLHQFPSLENTTNSWICDSDYVENDVKIRYHGRIMVVSLENIEALHIEIIILTLN